MIARWISSSRTFSRQWVEPVGRGGGGVLPIIWSNEDVPLDGVVFSRLIENNGLAVNRVPDRISRMRSQIAGILGVRKFWLVGFKLERLQKEL